MSIGLILCSAVLLTIASVLYAWLQFQKTAGAEQFEKAFDQKKESYIGWVVALSGMGGMLTLFAGLSS